MSGILSSDSQLIHDELEKAKETVSRLRCINGFTPGFCRDSAVCQGCWRYEHDITIGKGSERDDTYSGVRDDPWESINSPYSHVDSEGYGIGGGSSVKHHFYSTSRGSSSSHGKSGTSRAKFAMPREKSGVARADLARVHEQVNSLEKNVRGPILSYIQTIEEKNRNLADAVEIIQQQLLKHERECPAGSPNVLSGAVRSSSQSGRDRSWYDGSEKDQLMSRLNASYKAEQECRFRADNLQNELSMCREKLEKSEAKVKELFKNISLGGGATSGEMLLENRLQRQQQLAEGYLKESTSKEREVSFLTIEKYNLQSEVSSLLSDLESCNRKRDEMAQEQKKLQATLGANRQRVSDLQSELAAVKSENRRLKTKFRDELGKERSVSEQKNQRLYNNDREIKELGKKVKKYEENFASHKDVTYRLEHEKLELLSKAKHLNSELKVKESECKKLQHENEKLGKDIREAQQDAILCKRDSENSSVYVESLKSELKEVQSSVKILEQSLTESKVNESKTTTEIERFISQELDLKSQIESYEKDKIVLTQEVSVLRKREVDHANEITQIRESFGTSEKGLNDLTQNYTALESDLKLSREKCAQLQKEKEELMLTKGDLEKSAEVLKDELIQITDNYNDLDVKSTRVSSDLKAYKRIVAERDDQLKKIELEIAELHKKQDKDLKELLRSDKEIAFLKARVSSVERNARSNLGTGRSLSQSNLSTLQRDAVPPSKETEIYLERIVELESENKAQRGEIEKFQKEEFNSKKEAQRSDSLKNELAQQDEEIQRLKREISRLKQITEDLSVKEEQLGTVEVERERLKQEVIKLRAKVEETEQLKEDWEQKEQEIKALRRMSSDEADLEGKVSRFKDRCREKDEEIEELHKKVIALQTKIKDFVQQNSHAEEQVRHMKEKYATELNEKDKISHALSASETKCRGLEEDVARLESSSADLEKKVVEMKAMVNSVVSEKDECKDEMEGLTAETKKSEEEIERLRKQILELEEAVKQKDELLAVNEAPDGESTPLDNSFDGSRVTSSRNGRASALDRLEVLEEENIQLLNRTAELEDELDASEQHAQELKNALKAKRENVNDLHADMDLANERIKSLEKRKVELVEENEHLQQTYILAKQKIEDLKVSNERYVEESDELEKALTTTEQRAEELEKRVEELSGKCVSSEGHLQSMSERFSRKEKELEVVENQVEEQRKLYDGLKAAAEKQETLIEKLRAEKTSAEEALLAMKLEISKKEVTYKAGKDKVAEMQSRLYQTEDKFSSKTNELKKITRENERLKREIKDLESKVTELQTSLKRSKSLELEKTSPVTGMYNTTFQKITTSVKGNSQSMEGLDTKLNQAQNKISTLEVELANDLRKFSLHRSSSTSFSPSDSRLSPGSYNLRRPRSYSNMSADDHDSPMSFTKSVSSPSINGDVGSDMKSRSTPEISIPYIDVNTSEYTPNSPEGDVSLNLGDEGEFEASGEASNTPAENQLSEVDPFLTTQSRFSSEETDLNPDEQISPYIAKEVAQDLENDAMSFFVEEFSARGSPVQEIASVQEVVTSSSSPVTGNMTSLSSPSIQLGLNGEEEMIYF
ncbi:WEB family protein At4g27595, chloroplastic-like [Dendronephthya gigantea]|uniref:WEB family protein At4g27595, chloroplastic-like n=1 Tax=Dendronephthya gigantea TaxID=151771 RepID=UPI00106B3D11|nr:WEB family protein At4g27595, chloroplastic-like [Dendronephthya gigantea]